MSIVRAYTWSLVLYCSVEEFAPLRDKARHWAYCVHDKDFVTEEDGTRRPKETHTHVIVTFENEQSLVAIKKLIDSNQNVLGQPLKNKVTQSGGGESVRGMWNYLIHRFNEDKHQYEESERICDDLEYWQHRCKEELDIFAKNDSFFEDLTSEDFSIEAMGRKYGRDFMKNMHHYMSFRQSIINERQWEKERKAKAEQDALWQELEQFALENCLDREEIKNSLYYMAMHAHAEREMHKLFTIPKKKN